MTGYEWVIETVEDEYGDVVELTHADSYAEARECAAAAAAGYVQSKGKLWGVTPQYDAFLRALKATQTGAR